MSTSFKRRIDVDEAERLVLETMPRWPATRVPLDRALGGVLRETISAERDQPPFDRVTMDGIAVASAALAAGRREFHVGGTQAAGAPPLALGSTDACVEVMTGSVVPAGTDTVIPVERIARNGERVTIEAGYTANAGQFIHRRGSDHARGAPLLASGTVIMPPETAILTVSGQSDVAITRPPRIGVISTGDELVEPGAPIEDYQIRSSNDRALAAALRHRGFGQITRTTLRDDPAVLREEIGRLHAECDVLVLSGGVSMGQFDHVPATLTALGVEAVFHKVLQRPGMPLWFGRDASGKVVFALPGNPVSSLVCLIRYVVPGLQAGLGLPLQQARHAKLAAPVDFAADLTYFLPVQLEWSGDGSVHARPRPTNTSGDFVALGGTDGFVELPRGADRFPAGYAAKLFGW